MKPLRSAKRKTRTDQQTLLPDMVTLLKYEMSAASKDEIVEMCQKLIKSGRLGDFSHPLRRTCHDLAMAGLVGDLQVPPGFMEMTMDPERASVLHTTVH